MCSVSTQVSDHHRNPCCATAGPVTQRVVCMCVHVYFCLCMRSLRLSKVHTIRSADKFTELEFLLFNLLVRSYFSYFKFIFFVQS